MQGEETDENEYPWHAGLVFIDEWKPFCGATIISNKYVLTAAHCTMWFPSADFEVVVGEHDVGVHHGDGAKKVAVAEKFEHPSYSMKTLNYDFSLLRLEEPLSYSAAVSPVCLPSPVDPEEPAGSLAIVSGWGKLSGKFEAKTSLVLMHIKVKILSLERCRELYEWDDITDRMICARAKGRDSCQGDSGGPLTINKEGTFHLAGVVSFGKECASHQYPGVYAKVGVKDVLRWIANLTSHSTCHV